MNQDGFDALLKELITKLTSGDFHNNIERVIKDGRGPSRMFDHCVISDELSTRMFNELPQTLIKTEFRLEISRVMDPDAHDHLTQAAQYQELYNIFKPYLDIITYKISSTILTQDVFDSEEPIELRETIRQGLSPRYYDLERVVGYEELISQIYSAFFSIYGQELTLAQAKSCGISQSHVYSTQQSEESDHFGVITNMIDDYKKNLSLEKIIHCSPEYISSLGDQFHDAGNIPLALECYLLALPREPEKLLHVGDKIFNNAIQKLSTITTTLPLFTPYKDLNTLCETLMNVKNEYEKTGSKEAFDRMLETLDDSIQRLEDHCKTDPKLWNTTLKPLFKALLGAVILMTIGISGYGAYYLSTHRQERQAFMDSFFNQNKTLKERLTIFKEQFEEVKDVIANENAPQNSK